MSFFGILGTPLGYVMRFIYDLVQNYGWAIIIFTVLIRVLSFPLQLYQQKSTARMSVFQPMMADIQKKYAKDRVKQNEELQKLQEEYGYNPTAGCAPMFLNFFVLFGVIEVVYRPLQHVLMLSSDTISAALELIGLSGSNYTAQSTLMEQIKGMSAAEALSQFGSALSADQIASIQNFEMNFLGIDLCSTPYLAFSAEALKLMIFPALSVVTMCLVNVITMRMQGNMTDQMSASMKMMPWMMSIFFVWFCFRVPVAFSLYYTVSNLLMFVTSVLAKKIFDPEKEKQKYEQELKEKRAARKKKTEVEVTDSKGKKVTKQLNEAEMNRLRLERARKIDEEKYANERTEPLVKPEAPKAEAPRAEEVKAEEGKAEQPAEEPKPAEQPQTAEAAAEQPEAPKAEE